MDCPRCKKSLSDIIFYNTAVSYCDSCLGIWFDDDELRNAKDEKDKELKWVDVDLWENNEKFRVSYGIRICPCCRVPLYEIYYGDSKIIVDVCNLCHGIWLDRAEFKKIISYLRRKSDYEVLHNYSKSLFSEITEVFTGPETLRSELVDLLMILKVLNAKFLIHYPDISKLITLLPR